MRKLGGQSGAAAAVAGEPAKGELIKHIGADQTTLARLSASLEDGALFDTPDLDDLAQIEAAFARRNDELAEALQAGRKWFGVKDTLAGRLATILESGSSDVWAAVPSSISLPDEEVSVVQAAESPTQETKLPMVEMLPEEPQRAEKTAVSCEPVQPVGSTVPQVAGTAPVQPVILVFVDEEPIQRARKRRGGHAPRRLPRTKNPVTVQENPAEP